MSLVIPNPEPETHARDTRLLQKFWYLPHKWADGTAWHTSHGRRSQPRYPLSSISFLPVNATPTTWCRSSNIGRVNHRLANRDPGNCGDHGNGSGEITHFLSYLMMLCQLVFPIHDLNLPLKIWTTLANHENMHLLTSTFGCFPIVTGSAIEPTLLAKSISQNYEFGIIIVHMPHNNQQEVMPVAKDQSIALVVTRVEVEVKQRKGAGEDADDPQFETSCQLGNRHATEKTKISHRTWWGRGQQCPNIIILCPCGRRLLCHYQQRLDRRQHASRVGGKGKVCRWRHHDDWQRRRQCGWRCHHEFKVHNAPVDWASAHAGVEDVCVGEGARGEEGHIIWW